MKPLDSAKSDRQAQQTLEQFCTGITPLSLKRISRNVAQNNGFTLDFVAEVECGGVSRYFNVVVKSSGQPRVMREVAGQLRRLHADRADVIPIVMAPFLSDAARRVCQDEGIGFVDFLGNAHVEFDAVFIDRQVAGKPEPERRALRSLFKPQSARVIRVLLADPRRAWKVIELSNAARVSVGLVSNIRTELRERCWADQTDQGLILVDPDALLDAWAEEVDPGRSREVRRYTLLDGDALARRLLQLPAKAGRIVLSSFSAADWWAPHVRQQSTFFYADDEGLSSLERTLELAPATASANVVIRVVDEPGILDDAIELDGGLRVTSPVQTYLDLVQLGREGQLGAEHLRAALLNWQKPDVEPELPPAPAADVGFMLQDANRLNDYISTAPGPFAKRENVS